MAEPLDDGLTAAATSTVGESDRDTNLEASALDWAAERFQFDPNTADPQPGVEDLQKWLLSYDRTVALDGRLGPQTLAAVERAYADSRMDKAAEFKAEAESIDEPEPVPTPGSEEEPVSARPVALSDSAIEDISQDRLGFRPYVEAVAEFILAEQTRPPLAIAIDAPWGRGKTSFMKLIDAQLHSDARRTTVKVATTWFNPWKFSEPQQVWAAFVANVTRSLRDGLTPVQSWRFRLKRMRTKWHRHADVPFLLRLFVALAFLFIVGSLAAMDWSGVREALFTDQKTLEAFYQAAKVSSGGIFWYLPISLVAVLAIVYGYVTFADKLGLNLLEYVEKTDFKDKIGTLSQFEYEMSELSKAVPKELKVVVFIDDLDRCRGKVLGEIIEALQLADVSRSCIFVLGMDMRKVANAVESDRDELTLSVDSPQTRMEHGNGYKFLEKIIQARLSLPAYGDKNMRALVKSAVGTDEEEKQEESGRPSTPEGRVHGQPAAAEPSGILQAPMRVVRGLAGEKKETPRDSKVVTDIAEEYGSKHFQNPRRLKRFINGFRLHTYLTGEVRRTSGEESLPPPLQSPGTQLDRLARFLVLAEKWPALVDYMLEEDLGSSAFKESLEGKGVGELSMAFADEIRQLSNKERRKLSALLFGPKLTDPLKAQDLQDLSEWYGFSYYRSPQPKPASG